MNTDPSQTCGNFLSPSLIGLNEWRMEWVLSPLCNVSVPQPNDIGKINLKHSHSLMHTYSPKVSQSFSLFHTHTQTQNQKSRLALNYTRSLQLHDTSSTDMSSHIAFHAVDTYWNIFFQDLTKTSQCMSLNGNRLYSSSALYSPTAIHGNLFDLICHAGQYGSLLWTYLANYK